MRQKKKKKSTGLVDFILKTVQKNKTIYYVQATDKTKDWIENYNGNITLKMVSDDDSFRIYYAAGKKKTFTLFHSLGSDKLLSKVYTVAYLGLYCTSKFFSISF